MYTIIGDPHITHKSLDRAGTLFDIIEDLGNPTILLGDVLDTKEIIRGKCLNYVYERLRDSKLEYIILVGNHDWFNLECKEHSLEVLKSLPNVTVVDKPQVIDGMLFVPYINDLEEFRAVHGNPEFSEAEVMFMHQGVTGFDYGNGYIADGSGHGELPEEAMTGFQRVISGHFHKYAEEGNLTFLGTPFSHSFGESNQIKYIGLYDKDSDNLELLETPFPRHLTVTLDMDSHETQILPDIENNFVRFILTGSEEKIKGFDKSRFPGVKFIEKPTVNDEDSSLLDETDSNEKIFQTWANDIKELDEDTIKLGLEILGEVK